MASTTDQRAQDITVLAWTMGIAIVWVVAAVLRTDTTLHLGPLLLPLVPAILGRDARHPLQLTLAGIGIGAATIALLFLTGNLNGPGLGSFPDALAESIVLLAVGGVIGLGIAMSANRRTA